MGIIITIIVVIIIIALLLLLQYVPHVCSHQLQSQLRAARPLCLAWIYTLFT